MAKSSNRYLRYYLIQAANGMRLHIPEYSRFYARKYREANKHKHKRALVLTARKSVGLFVGLLHRNGAYRSKEAWPLSARGPLTAAMLPLAPGRQTRSPGPVEQD